MLTCIAVLLFLYFLFSIYLVCRAEPSKTKSLLFIGINAAAVLVSFLMFGFVSPFSLMAYLLLNHPFS